MMWRSRYGRIRQTYKPGFFFEQTCNKGFVDKTMIIQVVSSSCYIIPLIWNSLNKSTKQSKQSHQLWRITSGLVCFKNHCRVLFPHDLFISSEYFERLEIYIPQLKQKKKAFKVSYVQFLNKTNISLRIHATICLNLV